MSKKIMIVKTRLLKDSEQTKFDFLNHYNDIEFEYLEEYLDDDSAPIERQLRLEKNGPDDFSYSEEYIRKLQSAHIIISFYSPIPSAALSGGNVEAVMILRSGVENVNLVRAREAGVVVMNTPGRLAIPVAEFTVGMIIAEMKNIARGHHKLISGEWETKYSNSDIIYNLNGRNVGIIGYGAIGAYVANIMKSFHANILVYDGYRSDQEILAEGCEPVSLDELCERADVIAMHYRLTEETKDLLNERHFEKMKPTAYVINTARAGLINRQALLNALSEKKIAGAALDVFYEEPLSEDNPLLHYDNVTLTPHLAGTCTDLLDITISIARKCLESYFATNKWTNVVC